MAKFVIGKVGFATRIQWIASSSVYGWGNKSLRLRQIFLLFACRTSDSSSPVLQSRSVDLLSFNSIVVRVRFIIRVNRDQRYQSLRRAIQTQWKKTSAASVQYKNWR